LSAPIWASCGRPGCAAAAWGWIYGVGNLGKFIGPAGLALIAGQTNLVSPKATLDALVPGFNYFAFWYVLGAAAFWRIGFETSGRTIEEIERSLSPAGD
jgi:putative MFS transporter